MLVPTNLQGRSLGGLSGHWLHGTFAALILIPLSHYASRFLRLKFDAN